MTSESPPAICSGERARAAVRRWAAALPAERYLVVAIPAEDDGPTHRRLFTLGEFDHAFGWLRWLNCRGYNIVGRPWDARHVLIDDLPEPAVATLATRHKPAAVVESSPNNFQVWLTLSDDTVPPAIAGAAARLLAARHGGDRGAASPCQPGRIPGLTNRKPHRRLENGLFPFALLRHAEGPVIDPAGAEVLAAAVKLTAKAQRSCRPEADVAHPVEPGRRLIRRNPTAEHTAAMVRISASLPPGVPLDRSRADHAAAHRLLARGMSVAEVTRVVLAGERATTMPAAEAAIYAQRTVTAAMTVLGRRPAPWC